MKIMTRRGLSLPTFTDLSKMQLKVPIQNFDGKISCEIDLCLRPYITYKISMANIPKDMLKLNFIVCAAQANAKQSTS